MKEDILEQIVEDWLLSQDSTFTKHNIKFKPDKNSQEFSALTDSNSSDIDILAVHLKNIGKERVTVVSCKSWQGGFDTNDWLKCLTTNEGCTKKGGREAWKYFRELTKQRWAKAFVEKIYAETGQRSFNYCIAVTRLKKDRGRTNFQNCSLFRDMLTDAGAEDVEIKIITASEMIDTYFDEKDTSHTLAATQLGRLMQIIKASGIRLSNSS
jgi:hypothetical protein